MDNPFALSAENLPAKTTTISGKGGVIQCPRQSKGVKFMRKVNKTETNQTSLIDRRIWSLL
jgi:hypothetical protein